MATVRERIEQFCTAYYLGDAHTFCDPDNGEMVSATYEVQAFANALINGPLMDDADEVDARIAEAVAGARHRISDWAWEIARQHDKEAKRLGLILNGRQRFAARKFRQFAAAIREDDHDG